MSELRLCSVDGCSREVYARDYCNPHYNRVRLKGSPGSAQIRARASRGSLVCETCGRGRARLVARGMCRSCYQWFLDNTPRAEREVPVGASASRTRSARPDIRGAYPSDEELVSWFAELRNWRLVAERVGVRRETLRSYVKARPDLEARVQALGSFQLSLEEKERRNQVARRRWRTENPEKVKSSKRRWASGRSTEKRRSADVVRAANRRANEERSKPSREESVLAADYAEVVRFDPCSYCFDAGGSVDHIVPLNAGGMDVWENYTGSCRSCNSSKRDKDVLSFMLWNLSLWSMFAHARAASGCRCERGGVVHGQFERPLVAYPR